MADKQITIRMPQPLLDKWLAALRSGEYRQAAGRLCVNGGYCCLGVLQMAADGGVESYTDEGSGEPIVSRLVPTAAWVRGKGIQFIANNGQDDVVPLLPAFGVNADVANDSQLKTFPEMADAIEACAEGF